MEEDPLRETTREDLRAVRRALDEEDWQAARELLKPLVDAGDPEAQYAFGMYIALPGESALDFDARSLAYVRLSANQGYAPALYRLGVVYLIGEGVPKNKEYAAQLFKAAAEGGHFRAKISYAIDLFNGSNGIPQNKERARELMRECITNNIEGAASVLAEMDAA